MPEYSYQHPNGRIITIFQSMEGDHSVWVDEDGQKWKRIFDVPMKPVVGSLSQLNPRSPQEFVRATSNRRGKIGDLMELSAELSEKRKQKDGKDIYKEKSWDKYSKRRNGAVHPEKRKEQLKDFVRGNKHFDIEV